MRKVTREAVNAFEACQVGKFGSNTEVKNVELFNGEKGLFTGLFLHGNCIAVKNMITKEVFVSNAGWASNTTKDRLNSINGVSVSQRKFQWYLNGKEWNGSWTKIN